MPGTVLQVVNFTGTRQLAMTLPASTDPRAVVGKADRSTFGKRGLRRFPYCPV